MNLTTDEDEKQQTQEKIVRRPNPILYPTTNRVRTITTISPGTKRWIVSLSMLEDLRGFCYTDAPRDDELLWAVEGVRKVINEYLTERIRISIAEGNAMNAL